MLKEKLEEIAENESFSSVSYMLCYYFVMGYTVSDFRLHLQYRHNFYVAGGTFYQVVKEYSSFPRATYSRYRNYYRRMLQHGSGTEKSVEKILEAFIRSDEGISELTKLLNVSPQHVWRIKRRRRSKNGKTR